MEGEKSNAGDDLKIMTVMVEMVKNADKRVFELALKILMILCENNPKVTLPEFENKG